MFTFRKNKKLLYSPRFVRSVGIFLIGILIFSLFPYSASAGHLERKNAFPRLANYYLHAGPSINPLTYDILASFDILILAMEAQEYNKEFFEYARKKNPDIIILPYVPSRSINVISLDDGAQIRKRLKEGIADEWYLRDSKGSIVSAWPGTIPLNVATGWNSYLPQFINTTILSTGLWDGIFYDEVQDDMTYLNHGDIDLDKNGQIDMQSQAQEIWKNGNKKLFSETRKIIGEHKLLIINGSSYPEYQPFINGRMFENFPAKSDMQGSWADTMSQYLSLSVCSGLNATCIINANTKNTNASNDYQRMRFGYVSSLMGDGYFGFDYGDKDHGQLWLYDEYRAYLGHAKSNVETLKKEKVTSITQTILRREFENGIALLNATSQRAEVTLAEEYEKISGTQDPRHNDGSITSSFVLNPNDGTVLLRPLDTLHTIPFKNGSFVKILRQDGSLLRNGFFAYDNTVRGSATITTIDLDNDGTREKIIIDKGVVTIQKESGDTYLTLQPFGASYTENISLAFADSDSDGTLELVVAPSPDPKKTPTKKNKTTIQKKSKYSTRKVIQRITTKKSVSQLRSPSSIKIFNSQTGELQKSITPFGKNYKGDISLAVLSQKGLEPVLIVGSGYGLKPEIFFYSLNGKRIKKPLLAYSKTFKGGVHVSVGDIDGNGAYEIITGAGKGGSPHVKIFDYETGILQHEFFAYLAHSSSGVIVGAVDFDGNGSDEIIALTSDVFTTASE